MSTTAERDMVALVRDLARQIAAHLPGWQDADDDERGGREAVLQHTDGRRIRLVPPGYAGPRDRMECYGLLPPGPRPHSTVTPIIGVSVHRPADAIARDIARRLIPEHRQAVADVLAHQEQLARDQQAVADAARRLARALRYDHDPSPTRRSGDGQELSLFADSQGGGTWRLNVYRGRVSISLETRQLDADLAVRIAQLLRARRVVDL